MKILNAFKAVSADELQPGDLYLASINSKNCLCIMVAQDRSHETVQIFLSSGGVPDVRYGTLSTRNRSVISYGSEWVVELAGEPIDGFSHLDETAGHIRVSKEGFFLLAKAERGIYEIELADPSSDRMTRTSYATYAQWRIWESENALLRPGAKPLFEFLGGEIVTGE